MVTGRWLGSRQVKKLRGLVTAMEPSDVTVYSAATMELKRIESPAGKVIWLYDTCQICHLPYKYPKGARNPGVCNSFDCVHKKAHGLNIKGVE